MKRTLIILGIASVFALTGCGDGTASTDPVPPPAEEAPLPGEPGDDMNEDMDEDLDDELEEELDEDTEEGDN